METTGYIALSNQMVLRQQMDVIAQNLANMNTSGYQGESMMFVEHLTKTDDGKTLSFVQNIAMVRNLDPGPLTPTGNPLDVAIRGDGYFQVETPTGARFTRNGAFALDATGRLVNADGDPVLSNAGGEIVVPIDATSVSIARDGTVSTETGELGRVGVFRFENEQLMTKTGSTLYDAGELQPEVDDDPTLEQGMIEGSNVQGVMEMTDMISTVRRYQATNKVVEDEHRRQRQMIEVLSGNA
jgi:flagellar basal-body rod protein FlgF